MPTFTAQDIKDIADRTDRNAHNENYIFIAEKLNFGGAR